MTARGFPPPSNVRGQGEIRGPIERHFRALQAAARSDFSSLSALGLRVDDLEGLFAIPGYLFGGAVYFTATDTFDKADYPGLRAIIADVQAGGGAGAGAVATGSTGVSAGSGGGGGAYVRSLVLVSDLAASEAVTIGAAGAGSSGGAGGDGGDSILDTISSEVRGDGGLGGDVVTSTTADSIVFIAGGTGGLAGSNSVGDLEVGGQPGAPATVARQAANVALAGNGGGSYYGGGGRGQPQGGSGTNGAGGSGFGGGGGGSANGISQSARTGGAGSPGLIIIHLLY